MAAIEDGGEVSAEDLLAANMAARAGAKGITCVAFTATPKAKTLEVFGRRPDPSQPASPTNLPQPFHVYSMRQAIEEGFILDVLRNYTPYSLAFKLAARGRRTLSSTCGPSWMRKATMTSTKSTVWCGSISTRKRPMPIWWRRYLLWPTVC